MPANSNDYLPFALLIAFVAFLFFSNRSRKTAATQLTNSVKVGANVVMLGGITGKIVSISDSSVVVETTPGTKIEFVKAAIRSVTAPSLDKAPAVKKAATAKPATSKAAKASTTATKKTAK
jgi:preprotein translocase subunit YajC